MADSRGWATRGHRAWVLSQSWAEKTPQAWGAVGHSEADCYDLSLHGAGVLRPLTWPLPT